MSTASSVTKITIFASEAGFAYYNMKNNESYINNNFSMNMRSIAAGITTLVLCPIVGLVLPSVVFAIATPFNEYFGLLLMVVMVYGVVSAFFIGIFMTGAAIARRSYIIYNSNNQLFLNDYRIKEANKFVNGDILPLVLPYSTTDLNIIKDIAKEAVNIKPEVIFRVHPELLDKNILHNAITAENGIFKDDTSQMANSQIMSNIIVKLHPKYMKYVPAKYQTSELVTEVLENNQKNKTLHIRTFHLPLRQYLYSCIQQNKQFQIHPDILDVVISYYMPSNPDVYKLVSTEGINIKQFENIFGKNVVIYADKSTFNIGDNYSEIYLNKTNIIPDNLVRINMHPDTIINLDQGKIYMNRQCDAIINECN
jgi:hypothetical protein